MLRPPEPRKRAEISAPKSAGAIDLENEFKASMDAFVRCSKATATRDLGDLATRGTLHVFGGDRSTRYAVNLHLESHEFD